MALAPPASAAIVATSSVRVASAMHQSRRKLPQASRPSRTLGATSPHVAPDGLRHGGRHVRQVVSATMTTAPATADNEIGRLAALDRFDILDSETEPAFDRVASLAAHIFRTPIALISFVDRERQWHKSRIGIESSETPRALTLCDETIRSNSALLVADLRHDARFADKPAVRQQ